jgi:hypothetical protein
VHQLPLVQKPVNGCWAQMCTWGDEVSLFEGFNQFMNRRLGLILSQLDKILSRFIIDSPCLSPVISLIGKKRFDFIAAVFVKLDPSQNGASADMGPHGERNLPFAQGFLANEHLLFPVIEVAGYHIADNDKAKGCDFLFFVGCHFELLLLFGFLAWKYPSVPLVKQAKISVEETLRWGRKKLILFSG